MPARKTPATPTPTPTPITTLLANFLPVLLAHDDDGWDLCGEPFAM
jgi:hypothetical protein